jgi:hypothetical protein
LKFKHWSIFIGNLPIQIQTLVYFYKQPAIFQIPKRTLASVHASLKLVYFYKRPAHLKLKNWSVFMGDLPFLNSKKNFSKRPYYLEIGLFLQATYPF